MKRDHWRFGEALASRGIIRVREVGEAFGIAERTAARWWARPDVRAYVETLIQLEAAHLVVTRNRVVAEVAEIAMADMGSIVLQLQAARARVKARHSEGVDADLTEDAPAGETGEEGIPALTAERLEQEAIADLPSHASKVIKRLRFNTVRQRKFDAEGKVVSEVPVPVLSELELYNKMDALRVMGTWYNLDKDVTPDTPDAESDGGDGWQGNTIVAPIVKDKAT